MSFYLREFGLTFLVQKNPHLAVDKQTYPREFGLTFFPVLRGFGLIFT